MSCRLLERQAGGCARRTGIAIPSRGRSEAPGASLALCGFPEAKTVAVHVIANRPDDLARITHEPHVQNLAAKA